MADEPAKVSTGMWILEHFLALVTLGSCVYVYWFLTHFDLADLSAEVDPAQMPLGILFAGSWSLIGAVVFWLRMYRDFFRQRPRWHAAAWGLVLFVGAHLAALVYFLVIWRPRHVRRARQGAP